MNKQMRFGTILNQNQMRMFSTGSGSETKETFERQFKDPKLEAMRQALQEKADEAGVDLDTFIENTQRMAAGESLEQVLSDEELK